MNCIKKGMQSICIVSVLLFFISCETETEIDHEMLIQEELETTEALDSKSSISGYWQLINVSGLENASRITADIFGDPWIVKTNGDIVHYSNGKVNAIPGKARDIGTGGIYGTIWITNAANQIFYKDRIFGGDWVKIDGLAHTIDVDHIGNPWVLNKHNNIYKRINQISGYWSQQNGAALDIGVGAGRVYVIGTNKNVYLRKSDGSWANLGGIAERLDVDNIARAWVVNASNEIFVTRDGRFQKIQGAALDVGCGSREVYIVGINRRVYKWIHQ